MPSPPSLPTVYVAVLNWNKEADTAACLDSLLAQRGADLRILLIDNASSDGSGERLRARYSSICYLQTGENLGYTGGNNRGIQWARARGAEWVLVVNNDTVLERDCIRRLLEVAVAEPRVAAVAPLIVRYDDPQRVWFAGGRHDRLRAIGVHRHYGAPVRTVVAADGSAVARWQPCTFLTGCCLLLRAAALDQVGLLREDYFAYGEDVDLCVRLSRSGWRVGWVPGARIAHRVPAEGSPPTPRQIVLRDRNRRRLVRDHYPGRWRVAFALWFWPTRLIYLARYALTGDAARARAILAGMREP
jgi:GT2 family glycosyltransferase